MSPDVGADVAAGVGRPLVIVESRECVPTPGSLGLLGIARRLARTAIAVTFGPDALAVAATLGAFGADSSFACADPAVDADIGQAQADVVERLVRDLGVGTILIENSIAGADLAAVLAVRLGAGVNWDLQSIELRDGRRVGRRPALNETAAVEVGWTGDARIAVFRLGAVEPTAVPERGEGRVETVSLALPATVPAPRITARQGLGGEGADLATSDVVVAGGRGMKSPETLAILDDLAAALGGTVAVSAPIVDRGWAPHSRQVGQTGTRVRPRLYVACGISGQLAHRVGMEKSGTIVAINTDATAPIFGMCDAGLVGDLHEIVPELARRIREARAFGS